MSSLRRSKRHTTGTRPSSSTSDQGRIRTCDVILLNSSTTSSSEGSAPPLTFDCMPRASIQDSAEARSDALEGTGAVGGLIIQWFWKIYHQKKTLFYLNTLAGIPPLFLQDIFSRNIEYRTSGHHNSRIFGVSAKSGGSRSFVCRGHPKKQTEVQHVSSGERSMIYKNISTGTKPSPILERHTRMYQ